MSRLTNTTTRHVSLCFPLLKTLSLTFTRVIGWSCAQERLHISEEEAYSDFRSRIECRFGSAATAHATQSAQRSCHTRTGSQARSYRARGRYRSKQNSTGNSISGQSIISRKTSEATLPSPKSRIRSIFRRMNPFLPLSPLDFIESFLHQTFSFQLFPCSAIHLTVSEQSGV